jgi:hypothetical protein
MALLVPISPPRGVYEDLSRERSPKLLALMVAFELELEQPLKRRSCIQISQRIGSAANPGGRADGNRKKRGSRSLTFCSG